MKNIILCFSIATLLGFSDCALAHENHAHKEEEKPKAEATEEMQRDLNLINQDYLKTAKPIFEKNCMDCHSQNPRYPWYHGLPFVKGLIDSDITEARKHLDMTGGFPFKGHGSPLEDLEAIASSIKEGTMPPLRYLVMHPSAKISEEEKKVILSWIDRGQKLLMKRSIK